MLGMLRMFEMLFRSFGHGGTPVDKETLLREPFVGLVSQGKVLL
jgi:hypothetical protein